MMLLSVSSGTSVGRGGRGLVASYDIQPGDGGSPEHTWGGILHIALPSWSAY